MEIKKSWLKIDEMEPRIARAYSYWFNNKKDNVDSEIEELLKKLGFNLSIPYTFTHIFDTDNGLVATITDPNNNSYNIFLTRYDTERAVDIETYKTIEKDDNNRDNIVTISNCYHYITKNDKTKELVFWGYRKYVNSQKRIKKELNKPSYTIKHNQRIFRIDFDPNTETLSNNKNISFGLIIKNDGLNQGNELALSNETANKIIETVLKYTYPEDLIYEARDIANTLKEQIGNSIKFTLTVYNENDPYGIVEVINGRLIRLIEPLTKERKYSYENIYNEPNLEKDLEQIIKEVEAIMPTILMGEREKDVKKRELK